LCEITGRGKQYIYKLRNISHKLFYSIYNRNTVSPSIYSLIAFRVQQKYWQKATKEQESFNYMYWENRGWLDHKCKYYLGINTNYIKIKIARLLGDIVAIFFL
jgi:hypothetical protein